MFTVYGTYTPKPSCCFVGANVEILLFSCLECETWLYVFLAEREDIANEKDELKLGG